MRQIGYISILIFLFSCSQKQPDKITKLLQSDTFEIDEANIADNRINLDETLNQKHNNYLVSIADSVISLCCYEILNVIQSLDYEKFNKTTEKYEFDNQTRTVDVYFSGDSYLKEYFNDHPSVMHKDLVCGKIDDNKLITKSYVKIGMTKTQLLEMIFQPSELFKRVNRLDIYENELGESFTSYIFVNDKLKEIEFDSDYEWIDKKLKK